MIGNMVYLTTNVIPFSFCLLVFLTTFSSLHSLYFYLYCFYSSSNCPLLALVGSTHSLDSLLLFCRSPYQSPNVDLLRECVKDHSDLLQARYGTSLLFNAAAFPYISLETEPEL